MQRNQIKNETIVGWQQSGVKEKGISVLADSYDTFVVDSV